MDEHRSPSHSNPTVDAAGSLKEQSSGSAFGGVDIGESEGGYFLRVAMPGAMRDEGSFSISKDGTVEIQGVIRYEIPSQVPKMKVQQLYPPGPFALSLKLPGRVDPRMFTCKLSINTDALQECPHFGNHLPSQMTALWNPQPISLPWQLSVMSGYGDDPSGPLMA